MLFSPSGSFIVKGDLVPPTTAETMPLERFEGTFWLKVERLDGGGSRAEEFDPRKGRGKGIDDEESDEPEEPPVIAQIKRVNEKTTPASGCAPPAAKKPRVSVSPFKNSFGSGFMQEG